MMCARENVQTQEHNRATWVYLLYKLPRCQSPPSAERTILASLELWSGLFQKYIPTAWTKGEGGLVQVIQRKGYILFVFAFAEFCIFSIQQEKREGGSVVYPCFSYRIKAIRDRCT